ncbi:MAG: hypothetical protein Q8N88_07100 [Nanoarchaeota archaeon]|nr:hypothetical protein [Nanoarchaeota archaeon]
MFRRKCPSCAKNIEGKFNFCPYCGESFKKASEEEKYGILGKDDSLDLAGAGERLPLGMGRILDSLMKQLEKQMNEITTSGNSKVPKGFKVKISMGNPRTKQMAENKKPKIINFFSEEQMINKMKLPKEEAESRVRRLSDRIIYELITPGLKSPNDVVIIELASGFEVKAYSKNKCYTKFVPFALELIQYYIKDDKLIIELKN